jgi:hypothetical protein
MQVKMFEIRDRATFLPVIAIHLDFDNEVEQWLLSRIGFGTAMKYVLLIKGDECEYDPYVWTSRRTLRTAHLFIRDNFEILETGSVIDVEFILNESPEPKISERLELEKENG